jgi:hypothetical protein
MRFEGVECLFLGIIVPGPFPARAPGSAGPVAGTGDRPGWPRAGTSCGFSTPTGCGDGWGRAEAGWRPPRERGEERAELTLVKAKFWF